MNKNSHLPKIAIIQPLIPHYRQEFFSGIRKVYNTDLYCFESTSQSENMGFFQTESNYLQLKKWNVGPIYFLSIFPLLTRQYDVIIILAAIKSPSVWILLLIMKFCKCKTILWGHGISLPRYLKESRRIHYIRRLFYSLADMGWLYTENECHLWQKSISRKKFIALGNTISDVERITALPLHKFSTDLQKKYGIKTRCNFIFCARFSSPQRHPELLIQLIELLDPEQYGFIIIGTGPYKPEFSCYKNVYDYDAVYDSQVKDELFSIADIYFQPAWIGLSCVEAMAYGKPILTFQRTEDLHQGVEFFYIQDAKCGIIIHSLEEALQEIRKLSMEQIQLLGARAKNYVKANLTMAQMIRRANDSIADLLQLM
ncbi:glycosyltransferase [Victivallis sp. Marseille-Q1083]|uniref:glycosyltransferase n=1 Tax=Victivallis sp. Marseille-Q1083 TaxID=2717288 RepID=UPI00158D0C20|nr:glycosyltransferase [Victivallis sp. Marseille-Q1083]